MDMFSIDKLQIRRATASEREDEAFLWFYGTFHECVCGLMYCWVCKSLSNYCCRWQARPQTRQVGDHKAMRLLLFFSTTTTLRTGSMLFSKRNKSGYRPQQYHNREAGKGKGPQRKGRKASILNKKRQLQLWRMEPQRNGKVWQFLSLGEGWLCMWTSHGYGVQWTAKTLYCSEKKWNKWWR